MAKRTASTLIALLGRGPFSPRGLLSGAISIGVFFAVCHAAGLRPYVSVLSGTAPPGASNAASALALGAIYALAHFAWVLIAPVLILASAILLVVRGVERARATRRR